ncbi:MAG: hypothetical protein GY891_08980 [Bacteroidetes bacterium]|nr:hypothetical protein [Bacteroidota bacterium]
MSLLSDLNPEIRKAIDAEREMYPSSYKKMIKEMQDANVVTDLSVSTASTLISEGEAVGMNFESNNFVLRLYQIFGK